MPPTLSFLPLTFGTIGGLARLAPAPNKAHLVQPVNQTIAQSLVSQETHAFGVFRGDIAVGLIALEDARIMDHLRTQPVADCLLIWQLVVDGQHEGQGIGTAMVAFAKSYADAVGLSGVALATMDNADHTPLGFYEKLGFAPSSRLQDGDEDLLELIWRP